MYQMLLPDSVVWNIRATLRLLKPADPVALRGGLQAIQDRHSRPAHHLRDCSR